MTKFIFVAGGVMSGIGKGVATASIGKILESKGFNVTAIKIDPYINLDAGTMNPIEHGEVFVTDDGMECDQDIGNYERFLNKDIPKINYMTTGLIYETVIRKERNLEYGGKCVEVVPHIPEEVIRRIKKASKLAKADFTIIEIGGTVGEYQNILFLEAARMLKSSNPKDVLFVLVSYLPIPNKIGEMKTKPTQYAVRTVNSAGIQPDIILCRSEVPIDDRRKEKLSVFCNIRPEMIISAPDVDSIYEVPINFEKDNLGDKILKMFGMRKKKYDMQDWRKLSNMIKNLKKEVKIGIVGKYFSTGDFVLSDSYISVIESIKHASWFLKVKPIIHWINAEEYESASGRTKLDELKKLDGIIIPGGFGERGVEGKIKTVEFARKNKIPFLGLCYGLQIACIEYARNIAGLKEANSTEINRNTKYPVIDIMPEQKKNLEDSNYGATMRLGAYPALIKKRTLAWRAYKTPAISERHRHRWEVNPDYIEMFEKNGLIFSGKSPNGKLMEIIELSPKDHPFFIATQFHPELKSRPLAPHPLFRDFIKAAIAKNKK
ncbi:CTP synthase [Patescibacteria group bacterium]|nr:CTP synthase [Patescibacteria group bacterium]MBU4579533.1 CTP synthase [Patescibacteria group bacterium]